MVFFKKFPVEVVQLDEPTACTIYAMKDDKLVPLVPSGKPYTRHHWEFLQHNATSHIYIHTRDIRKMDRYTAQHLDKILSDPNLPGEVKAKVFYSSSSYTMEKVLDDPRTETISEMKAVIKGMLDHVITNPTLLFDLFTITAHDYYTYHHSLNVGIFATALAYSYYGDADPHNDIERLSYGFFLHDIGKALVPKEILNKPDKLTEEEWNIMKKHPQWGYNILMRTGHLTDEAAYIALEHHEQVNGSGYPNGIKGNEIHPCARICAIIDTFDALTTERPYKPAISPFDALRHMQQLLIHGFDPYYLETFILLLAPKQA